MTKLLTISNAKTVKGEKLGYLTGVLYLAPHKLSGWNVCPMADKFGCVESCLNTAGRGGIAKVDAPTLESTAHWAKPIRMNHVQAARLARTRLFFEDRPAFFEQLVKEIHALVRAADRKGLIPTVRLNGTSDISWEVMNVPRGPANRYGTGSETIFELFPDVQFYDYTKVAKRLTDSRAWRIPANYHLSLSFSGAVGTVDQRLLVRTWLEASQHRPVSLIYVVRDEQTKAECMQRFEGAIDGDEHDLRFLDPSFSRVFLKAKGRAKGDTSGFVCDELVSLISLASAYNEWWMGSKRYDHPRCDESRKTRPEANPRAFVNADGRAIAGIAYS